MDGDLFFDEHNEDDQYALWQRAQEIRESNGENELFDDEENCHGSCCNSEESCDCEECADV